MHKFTALLRLNLKAMLSSFRLGSKKRSRAVSGIGALALMALLACYMSATYSFLFASQLSEIGMLPLMMLLMPVMAVVMGIFFTLFAAQGVVFGGKDNDLLLSLPVSPFSLMLSRTLALYLENLVFCIFVMLPAGVAYLFFGGAGGVRFGVTLFFSTFFLALLPTLISFICGFVLAWLSSRFTRRSLLSTFLYFIFFALLLVGIFQLNRGLTDLAGAASGIQQGFTGWGLPFLLMQEAVCGGNLLSLLGFLAVCVLPFLLVVWIFAGRYKRIVTRLTARGARSDYRLGQMTAGSQRKALLKKEAARYFGTPIYIFNTGFGLLLALLASVAALVMRSRLRELLISLELVELPLMPVLAVLLAFFMSTVAVTASSISLEGKYLWILKEAPVSSRAVFTAKAGFQLFLCLPCLLIAVVCLGIAFSLSLLQGFLLFLSVGFFAVLTALFGLFINLCFPKLDAHNDTEVVKQSASALLATLGSMFLVLLGAGCYLLTSGVFGMEGAIALCAVFFAVCSAGLVWLLETKGRRMFEELS